MSTMFSGFIFVVMRRIRLESYQITHQNPARLPPRRDADFNAYYFTVTDVMCGFAPSYQYRKPSRSTV